jgi:hypothetical protein
MLRNFKTVLQLTGAYVEEGIAHAIPFVIQLTLQVSSRESDNYLGGTMWA